MNVPHMASMLQGNRPMSRDLLDHIRILHDANILKQLVYTILDSTNTSTMANSQF
jgi:hypothetical protein